MSIKMNEPKKIRLIIFSALLTALHDVMGRDGKNSVLRYAGLEKYIKEEVPPSINESISFEIFMSLIKSMNSLLGHGTDAILYESGRKFAIYLTPFGYSLRNVVEKLTDWLGGNWTVQEDDENIVVKIKNNPICTGISSNRPSCHVISGALAKIKEESTGYPHVATETLCETKGDTHCEFHVIKKDKVN